MTEWTDAAMDVWADYLAAVRDALDAAGSEDTDTVIRDFEDHASQAFRGSANPVSEGQMRALIERLGSPEFIATSVARSSRLRADAPGQRAGRLADVLGYASLALLALAILVPSTIPGAVPLAFILARLGVRQERVGPAQRAISYPALLIGSLGLAGMAALWPPALVIPLAALGGPVQPWLQARGLGDAFGTSEYWGVAWSMGLLAGAAWCVVLRTLVPRAPHVPAILFRSILDPARAVAWSTRALTISAGVQLTLSAGLFILTRL
ncbi:MAG: HAAS signaling domain-containing protein [Gemmatimonadaceae bacterium]